MIPAQSREHPAVTDIFNSLNGELRQLFTQTDAVTQTISDIHNKGINNVRQDVVDWAVRLEGITPDQEWLLEIVTRVKTLLSQARLYEYLDRGPQLERLAELLKKEGETLRELRETLRFSIAKPKSKKEWAWDHYSPQPFAEVVSEMFQENKCPKTVQRVTELLTIVTTAVTTDKELEALRLEFCVTPDKNHFVSVAKRVVALAPKTEYCEKLGSQIDGIDVVTKAQRGIRRDLQGTPAPAGWTEKWWSRSHTAACRILWGWHTEMDFCPPVEGDPWQAPSEGQFLLQESTPVEQAPGADTIDGAPLEESVASNSPLLTPQEPDDSAPPQ